MANLSSEQEELLKEIKATFSGEAAKTEESKDETDSEETYDYISEGDTTDVLMKKKTARSGSDKSGEGTDFSDLEDETDTPVKATPSKSMPKYGPGFKYVPIISIVTVAAIVLGHIGPIANGVPSNKIMRYIYIGIGVLILVWGFSLLLNAVSECAILLNAQMGKLITTGVYSKTRNPMYTGVTFICTAALFISGNVFMYFLPILYWGFLSYLMAQTEEKLLESTFGQDYLDYKNETYRFMPIKKRS